jgi:O-antigen ligase
MSPWRSGRVAEGLSASVTGISLRLRLSDRLHTVQVYGLAAILMFGVLAFGAVENWALFVMSATVVGLLICWSAEQMIRGRVQFTRSPMYLPLVGFGVIIVTQYVTQATAYLYATRSSLLTAIVLGMLFFVATESLSSRHDMDRFTSVFAAFGFILAVFAIAQHFASPNRIYWTFLPPDAGLVFGPYVNRNHFAGIMELLTPFAFVPAFDSHRPMAKRVLLAFIACIMASAIVLSQSRAGMLAFAAQVICFYCLFARESKRRSLLLVLIAILAASVFMGLWLSGGRALDRFAEVHDLRLRIAHDCLRMASQHPWFGWGAGTFESVYPEFRSYTSAFAVDHAHNDYLEALVETGVAGLAMVFAFIVVLYRTALRSLASRSWSRTGPRAAALVGCTGLLLHSVADFNMHIPANAAMFLVLAAIAVNTSAAKYAGSPRQIHWERRV